MFLNVNLCSSRLSQVVQSSQHERNFCRIKFYQASDHGRTVLYCTVKGKSLSCYRTCPDRDHICPLSWESGAMTSCTCRAERERGQHEVLQIYFSHGSSPTSVISDGVTRACPSLLVPEKHTRGGVAVRNNKKTTESSQCRNQHAAAGLQVSWEGNSGASLCARQSE